MVLYYIIYGLLYIISLLPLRVLYLVSDLAYPILYYVIGYRRKVVYSNLAQAFPEKTQRERIRIAKMFYRNFCDNFIEFIKLLSVNSKFIERHFYGDFSIPEKLYREGKRSQLLLAHSFNWEWACLSIANHINQPFLAVYMPITNKAFDRLFLRIRAKTGAVMLPANEMRTAILRYRTDPYFLGLVADQNPGDPRSARWFNFFGRPTPFVKGPETGARKGNVPTVFCRVIKEKRGYYRIIFEIGDDNPARLEEGELTRKYIDYLERIISETPETWLWSHRRWKWDWKEEYGKIFG